MEAMKGSPPCGSHLPLPPSPTSLQEWIFPSPHPSPPHFYLTTLAAQGSGLVCVCVCVCVSENDARKYKRMDGKGQDGEGGGGRKGEQLSVLPNRSFFLGQSLATQQQPLSLQKQQPPSIQSIVYTLYPRCISAGEEPPAASSIFLLVTKQNTKVTGGGGGGGPHP